METLSECYDLLDVVLEKAEVLATVCLLQCTVPLTQQHLGSVQQRLRNEACQWDEEVQLALKSARDNSRREHQTVDGDNWQSLRTAVKKKGERLGELLGSHQLGYADRSFWIASECYCLADTLVRGLRETRPKLTPADVSHLHGYVEGRVREVARRADGGNKERVLEMLRDVLRQNWSEIEKKKKGARGTPPSIDATVAEIAARMFASRDSPRLATDEDLNTARMWVSAKIVEFVGRHQFSLDVQCDCYVPTPAGDMVVVASSMQDVPGPPPKPFASRCVARGRLQGGVAVETRSPLPNDFPTDATNSNHTGEGCPKRTLAIPIQTREGEDHWLGQLFVAVRDSDAVTWAEMPGFFSFVLCAAARLSKLLSGRGPEMSWKGYLAPVLPCDAFRQRVRAEIGRAEPRKLQRTAFVVISGHAAFRGESDHTDSFEHVLDNWARFAALRLARGKEVYRLEQVATYVFIETNVQPPEWQRLHDREDFSPNRGVIEARCAQGDDAGYLGMWSVAWRVCQMADARDTLGSADLADLIERQVSIAGGAVLELSNLFVTYARGEYPKAFSIAAKLADEHVSTYGVVAADVARLAVHRLDFATAKTYSAARKEFATWDVEAHANYLMAVLGLGDVEEAMREIEECAVCRRYKEDVIGYKEDVIRGDWTAVEAFPMQALAQVLADSRKAVPPSIRLLAERVINRALHSLAPHRDAFRNQVRRGIEAVREYLRGQREEAPEEMLSDILRDLDDVETDDQGFLRNWKEIESLRRIVAVLRGMVQHATPARREAALPEPSGVLQDPQQQP